MKRFSPPRHLSIVLSFLLPVAAYCNPPLAANASTNAVDLNTWHLETLQGATGSLSAATDAPDGGPSLVVEAQTAGSGELWLVQIDYPTHIYAGKQYHLKFMMKSDPDRYVRISVGQHRAPYANLCAGKTIPLTSSWQEFDYDFTPKADETEARILLTNLNVPGSKFYLADMTLTIK